MAVNGPVMSVAAVDGLVTSETAVDGPVTSGTAVHGRSGDYSGMAVDGLVTRE